MKELPVQDLSGPSWILGLGIKNEEFLYSCPNAVQPARGRLGSFDFNNI
jgi:hypothetical protein